MKAACLMAAASVVLGAVAYLTAIAGQQRPAPFAPSAWELAK